MIFHFLFNPFFLYFIVPALLVGIIFGFYKYSNTALNKKARKSAGVAAFLIFVAYGIYVVYNIAKSERSTALLGIIEIPFGGIPLAILTFVITWGLSSLVFERFSNLSESTKTLSSRRRMLAISVVIFFVFFECIEGYSTFLIRKAKASQDAAELYKVYDNFFGRYDEEIFAALARNESTSPELLGKLALDERGYIKSGVARNPSTPPEILRFLYENQDPDPYSSGYLLYSLAVNPSVPADILIKLSELGDKTIVVGNLTLNPNLPQEVLCKLKNRASIQRQIEEKNIKCE